MREKKNKPKNEKKTQKTKQNETMYVGEIVGKPTESSSNEVHNITKNKDRFENGLDECQ